MSCEATDLDLVSDTLISYHMPEMRTLFMFGAVDCFIERRMVPMRWVGFDISAGDVFYDYSFLEFHWPLIAASSLGGLLPLKRRGVQQDGDSKPEPDELS